MEKIEWAHEMSLTVVKLYDHPHDPREFVCIVHLGKLQDTGVGKSKKNAKRAAAFNMLKKLELEASILDDADAAGLDQDREYWAKSDEVQVWYGCRPHDSLYWQRVVPYCLHTRSGNE